MKYYEVIEHNQKDIRLRDVLNYLSLKEFLVASNWASG